MFGRDTADKWYMDFSYFDKRYGNHTTSKAIGYPSREKAIEAARRAESDHSDIVVTNARAYPKSRLSRLWQTQHFTFKFQNRYRQKGDQQ